MDSEAANVTFEPSGGADVSLVLSAGRITRLYEMPGLKPEIV